MLISQFIKGGGNAALLLRRVRVVNQSISSSWVAVVPPYSCGECASSINQSINRSRATQGNTCHQSVSQLVDQVPSICNGSISHSVGRLVGRSSTRHQSINQSINQSISWRVHGQSINQSVSPSNGECMGTVNVVQWRESRWESTEAIDQSVTQAESTKAG